MRIGLFLGNISGPGSGAWTRVESLLTASERVDPGVEFVVYGRPELTQHLVDHPNVSLRDVGYRNRWSWIVFGVFRAPQLVRRDRVDVAQFETGPLLRRLPVPVVLTIHDLREFHDGPSGGVRRAANAMRRFLIRRSAHVASRILTLTQWSGSDIVEQLGVRPDKVFDVPFSVDLASRADRESSTSTESRFVLALGHLEPRKNLEVLIRAAAESDWPSDLELIIAGRDNGAGSLLQELAASLHSPVRFVGKVSAAKKQELLEGAVLVLVPSLLEGFGIVVSEAVLSGTPVLVSDRSALPEAVGVPDAVVSATDPAAWVARVNQITGNDSDRSDLLAAEVAALGRFTHDNVGRTYLSAMAS